jgi:hypothetical protein
MMKAHHMEDIREARKAEQEKRMEIRKAKLQGRRRRDKKLTLRSVQPAINDSANCEPANGEPTIDHTMIEPTLCDPLELDLANGQRIDADTSKLAHGDGMAMLDEYYRNSPVDLGCVDGILAFDTLTHQSPPTDDLDTTLNASECARLQNSDLLLETHKTNMNPPCTTLKKYSVRRLVGRRF